MKQAKKNKEYKLKMIQVRELVYRLREYVTEQHVEHMLQMKRYILNNKLVPVRPASEIEKKETKGTTKKLRPV